MSGKQHLNSLMQCLRALVWGCLRNGARRRAYPAKRKMGSAARPEVRGKMRFFRETTGRKVVATRPVSLVKKRAGEGMGGLGGRITRTSFLASLRKGWPSRVGSDLECFNFEKGETRRRRHSAARPKVSGKTAFFPRNDRPYGLKCTAFQTENALMAAAGRARCDEGSYGHRQQR